MNNNNNGKEQNPRQNTDPKKEDCPLCHISEETLKILKEKGKENPPSGGKK